MAVSSAVRGILLICCCTAGLSYARSLQASQNGAEDDVSMTQVMTASEVRCDVAGCDYDLQLFCLENGVIVMGSCSLKNTLCADGERNTLRLAKDWNSCFLATYTVHHPHQMVMVHTNNANNAHTRNIHIKDLNMDPADGQLLDSESVEGGPMSAAQQTELTQAMGTQMADTPDLLDLQLEQELSKTDGMVKDTGVKADADSRDKA